MTKPDNFQASQPLPLHVPLGEWLRSLAIQRARGTGSTPRTRPLWSTVLPPLGLGDSLVVELLPTLALRVRNVVTDAVLITTEPVDFGPLASDSQASEQRDSGQASLDKFDRRGADAGDSRMTPAVVDTSIPPDRRKSRATKAVASQPREALGAS